MTYATPPETKDDPKASDARRAVRIKVLEETATRAKIEATEFALSICADVWREGGGVADIVSRLEQHLEQLSLSDSTS